MDDTFDVTIIGGRHPVLELSKSVEEYIPNDITFSKNNIHALLLTGPNMAGKSSYLRQSALIIYMAQVGSFVPASHAHIGIVDRIFTRIGASDNLAEGQSTFMVEMQESAYIVRNATEKSFIILDEVGRGTSTYDGMSIAWALLEYLYTKVKAKTVFATHYHELTHQLSVLPYAKNISMAVTEHEQNVVFLHKVVEGAAHRSYGIEVAKIAGMPRDIVLTAQEYLGRLESSASKSSPIQQDLFQKSIIPQNTVEDEVKKLLGGANIHDMTPLDAFDFLRMLKSKIDK
jgi:DNA mismatch repair protein MutS